MADDQAAAPAELLVAYAGPGGRFSTLNDQGGYDHYDLGVPAPMSQATYDLLTSDPAHVGHHWAVHEPGEEQVPGAPSPRTEAEAVSPVRAGATAAATPTPAPVPAPGQQAPAPEQSPTGLGPAPTGGPKPETAGSKTDSTATSPAGAKPGE